jgi:hypothetical protein
MGRDSQKGLVVLDLQVYLIFAIDTAPGPVALQPENVIVFPIFRFCSWNLVCMHGELASFQSLVVLTRPSRSFRKLLQISLSSVLPKQIRSRH